MITALFCMIVGIACFAGGFELASRVEEVPRSWLIWMRQLITEARDALREAAMAQRCEAYWLARISVASTRMLQLARCIDDPSILHTAAPPRAYGQDENEQLSDGGDQKP